MSVVKVLNCCIYSYVQAAVVMLFHRCQYVTDIQTCFQSTFTCLINPHCFHLIKKCQSGINAYVCVFYSFFCIIIKSSYMQFSVVEPELRTNIALGTSEFFPPLCFLWTIHSTKLFFYLSAVFAVEYVKFRWFAGEICSFSPWGCQGTSIPSCMRSLMSESLS